MAEYDGSIRINTKIDTGDAKITLAALQHTIVKTADEIASLRSKMDAMKDVKFPTKEFTDLEAELKKATVEYEKLQKKMEEPGKPTEKYKALEKDLKKAQAELEKLAAQQQEAEEMGLPIQPKSIEILANASDRVDEIKAKMEALKEEGKAFVPKVDAKELDEAKKKIDELKQKMEDLKASGRDTVLGINTDEYANLSRRLGNEQKALAKYTVQYMATGVKNIISEAKRAYAQLSNIAKKAFSFLNKSQKNSNNSFSAGFKNILKYGLGIRSLYALVNKLRTAIKEGFSNMAKEVETFGAKVDSLKASSLTLKNSFAAAFRPLVEIAIPYIQKTSDALINLMNIIGQFAAAITGQKAYTKAIKQTTEAIKDETKAQNKQLSGLDKLNNLSSDSGGGSGGGASGQMFEENVPISNSFIDMYQNLKDLIESEDWEGLGAYIASSLNQGLQKIYDIISWNNVGPQITYFVDAFTRTLNSLIDNIDWDLLGRTIGTGINTVVNTLNLLIEGIDWINLGKSFATGIMGIVKEVNWVNLGNLIGNKFMIAWKTFYGFVTNLDYAEIGLALANMINGAVQKIDLGMIMISLSMFAVGLLEALSTAIANTDWSAVGKQIADALRAIDWMGIASGLFDVGLQLINGLLKAFGELPAPVQLAAVAIGSFMAAFKISSAITSFVALIKTVIGILTGAGGLSTAISAIVSALGGPLTIAIAAIIAVGTLLIAHWDEIKEVAGKLKDWLLEKWEEIKLGIEFAIAAIKLGIKAGLDFIYFLMVKGLGVIKDSIASVILGTIKIFSGLTDFISGVFTGNWKKAWDGIVKIFSGVGDVIKGIVNGILSVVESLANGVINGINFVIRALNGLSFDLPDWLPGDLGGKSIGFNIPELSQVSIPRLATGAVIPANKEFLAVLGDQKHGTNIEAPLATIEEAVENALNRHGGTGGVKELTIHVPFSVDGQVFYELIKKYDLEHFNSTGEPSFQI